MSHSVPSAPDKYCERAVNIISMGKGKRKRLKKAAGEKAVTGRKNGRKVFQGQTQKETLFGIRSDLLVSLFLCLITFAVYFQVKDHAFISFDDDDYVTRNIHIQKGFSSESIAWSFSSVVADNWHPLTWMSHMLDCQIYGLNPGPHHLTNLFFHIANALLLFVVLRRMTGGLWQSAFVAALFAFHPLHVESVAWVAERKDVLSTFFWMLTMWAYVRYVERPGISRYLLVPLFFTLGLMSKPMLVTLPFVLLLLDYWPLDRFKLGQAGVVGRLVLEKVPLFAITAVSSVATYMVQHGGGAVISSEIYPFGLRIGNALVSYVAYVMKMIWPSNLALLYPHPISLPWWQVLGTLLALVFVSFLAIRAIRQYPWFSVGWLWYVGTLVPVIGFVQVGVQAMADRYTYVPSIGIFIIIVWGAPKLLEQWHYKKAVLAILAGSVLVALSAVTILHLRNWTDSIAIFEHTLSVTGNNYVMHNNLGVELKKQGKVDEAMSHYAKSLEINPSGYGDVHNNLANILSAQGKMEEAIKHYSEALRINPGNAEMHNNLGVAFFRTGKVEDALYNFQEAIRIRPGLTEAHSNLKKVLSLQKN